MKSPFSWRWGITTCIACALFALGPSVCAQPAAKVYRIGVLGQGNAPRNTVPAADFRQALSDLGYKTVILEVRYAEGDADKLTKLADDLVRTKVDLIVTIGEPAASAAKRATSTIPIIATEFGQDPVKSGLVASLSRPGGNVTGLASISEELWLKRLQMLREFAPKISRIAVVMNPTNRGNVSCLAEVRAAGLGLGMQVRALEVSDARTVEAMLAALAKEPPDAIASCWDSVTLEHAQAVADFALRRRLPSVASVREYVESGMLLSFGVNLPAQRRRAADLAHRIIKGEKPSDVPVEQPTHFELVLNMATVKALSLVIPPALGALVDDVYPPRSTP